MKKFIFSLAALMLFAGITNAQQLQKQAAKATPAKEITTVKKPMPAHHATSSTASVTPKNTAAKKTTASATVIKRKHHTKKSKPLPKTENK